MKRLFGLILVLLVIFSSFSFLSGNELEANIERQRLRIIAGVDMKILGVCALGDSELIYCDFKENEAMVSVSYCDNKYSAKNEIYILAMYKCLKVLYAIVPSSAQGSNDIKVVIFNEKYGDSNIKSYIHNTYSTENVTDGRIEEPVFHIIAPSDCLATF